LKKDLRPTAHLTIRKLIKASKIRPEAFDMFNVSRTRLAFDCFRSTRLSPHNSWRVMPMIWFSEFLNWMDRRDDPWTSEETR